MPVTVKATAFDVTPDHAAETEAVPAIMPVALPEVSISATQEGLLVQVTDELRSCAKESPPSLNVPVAVNCANVPRLIVGGEDGVTTMETRGRFLTVNTVLPVKPPGPAAVIVQGIAEVTDPTVASPVALIVMSGSEEVHATEPVMFTVVESELTPVAMSWIDELPAMLAFPGVIERETR
jgi:hypothetical protein